jgi:two-component system, OmpR family, KDP operon response regulator KdpE
VTRVLVVDDEPQILRALRINLRVRQYEVYTAATGGQALEEAAAHPPDLVILDLGLPDMDGVDVIGGLRGWTAAPIIVLSGRADSADKVEAVRRRRAAGQDAGRRAPHAGRRRAAAGAAR